MTDETFTQVELKPLAEIYMAGDQPEYVEWLTGRLNAVAAFALKQGKLLDAERERYETAVVHADNVERRCAKARANDHDERTAAREVVEAARKIRECQDDIWPAFDDTLREYDRVRKEQG